MKTLQTILKHIKKSESYGTLGARQYSASEKQDQAIPTPERNKSLNLMRASFIAGISTVPVEDYLPRLIDDLKAKIPPYDENGQQGAFYQPFFSHEKQINELVPVDKRYVSTAKVFVGLSRVTRTVEKALTEVEHLLKLYGVDNVHQLQKQIGPIVVYVPKSNENFDNHQAMEWLQYPDISTIMATETPKDIYEQFIQPKLFDKDNKLVPPERFNANFVTCSYFGRRVEMILSLLAWNVAKHGGDPAKFLSRCYGLHLTFNAGVGTSDLFNRIYAESANKPANIKDKIWLKPVVENINSDAIAGLTDLLTIQKFEVFMNLPAYARYELENNPNHINKKLRIARTNRTLITVEPSPIKNYFGHNTLNAINALIEEHPDFVKDMRRYFREDISLEEFNKVRYKEIFNYDPLNAPKFEGQKDPVSRLSPAQTKLQELRLQALAIELDTRPINSPGQKPPHFQHIIDKISGKDDKPSDNTKDKIKEANETNNNNSFADKIKRSDNNCRLSTTGKIQHILDSGTLPFSERNYEPLCLKTE